MSKELKTTLAACPEKTTIKEMIEILESLGWDYAESSDETGDMFLYWDHTKDMPEWCPDAITSCECLDDVWRWYLERRGP